MTTLVVTNDFPPRIGGIESFVADCCRLLDDDVVVYTSGPTGAGATDTERGYPVVRDGDLLLPTPRTARRAAGLLRDYACDRVLFGAAAPLGLLAPALRRAGAIRVVGLTHGHEVWWATLPGARGLLRRIGDSCDHLAVISDYTAGRIGPALSRSARQRIIRLPPPVDPDRFVPRPALSSAAFRCIAVGRFVPQKGFGVLLDAWALVAEQRTEHPVELVLVGDGPLRDGLLARISRLGLDGSVRLAGALPRAGVVNELQRADVFALPVRTRLAGLHPEGLGLAGIEAAACGLPVIVGRSGGAPEVVRPGVTGFVVDPHDPADLAARLVALAADRPAARAMGERGRAFVVERYGASSVRRRLRAALGLT